jgi:hypothetical protein
MPLERGGFLAAGKVEDPPAVGQSGTLGTGSALVRRQGLAR